MSDLVAQMVTDVGVLRGLSDEWDGLAVACARPLSAPGWLLSWWETLAPRGALLRTVIVREGGSLVGIAPFYVSRHLGVVHYRPLGSGMANRNTPLAVPGRERDVAAGVASALATAKPRPSIISFDQIDAASPWPEAIRSSWPGRPPVSEIVRTAPSPTLDLSAESFDEWLAAKSSNFRQRLRRDGRRLEKRGARVRAVSEVEDLKAVLDAFALLHGARWGDASWLTEASGHELMVRAARELPGPRRFRAYVIEADDRIVSVQLFLAAGGEVAYWNGGWDPQWGQLSPAIQAIAAGVREAFELGDLRVDFGEGDHHYKRRLADGDDPVCWPRLYPRGRGHLRARGTGLLPRFRRRLARALDSLPPGIRRRVDRLRGRAPA